MINEIREWMDKWESIWLFIVLFIGLLYERYTAKMSKLEYDYDKNKDEAKAQRKTRTSKKTTTQPGGASVVEEQTEVSENIPEQKAEPK